MTPAIERIRAEVRALPASERARLLDILAADAAGPLADLERLLTGDVDTGWCVTFDAHGAVTSTQRPRRHKASRAS